MEGQWECSALARFPRDVAVGNKQYGGTRESHTKLRLAELR